MLHIIEFLTSSYNSSQFFFFFFIAAIFFGKKPSSGRLIMAWDHCSRPPTRMLFLQRSPPCPVSFSSLFLALSHSYLQLNSRCQCISIVSWGCWAHVLHNGFSYSPCFKRLAQSAKCWQLGLECACCESPAFEQVESRVGGKCSRTSGDCGGSRGTTIDCCNLQQCPWYLCRVGCWHNQSSVNWLEINHQCEREVCIATFLWNRYISLTKSWLHEGDKVCYVPILANLNHGSSKQ